jgi:uncharacterized membrane protein
VKRWCAVPGPIAALLHRGARHALEPLIAGAIHRMYGRLGVATCPNGPVSTVGSVITETAPTEPLDGKVYPPPGRSEPIWPAHVAVLSAIALQLLLPKRLAAGPTWLLPALEAALFVGLAVAAPRQLGREYRWRRRTNLGLTALVSAANITSLALLSHELLHHGSPNGRELITSGALVWLTNVLIFGLWYWEIDRGGPGTRAAGCDGPPDLLFPQMNDDRIEPIDWRPQFIDYLYVSLTNALALSPTDTMPLSPRAKGIMGIQSLVSLVTVGLIVARAVNILS